MLFMLQLQAAFSGSSSLKSEYGTSVSAKGTVGHTILLKQQHQQQLLRKEEGNGDIESDILGNQSDMQSLADLDASLRAENDKKSLDDSKYSDASITSTDLGNDLLDTKDSSKLLDDSRESNNLGDTSMDVKDTNGSDDALKETMALDELKEGAKDAQDSDLLKSLRADMAADNEAHSTPQKVESLDQTATELDNEDASFKSINADLADLHKQVFGDSKPKKDVPSLNSSVLQVAAAQQASDWLDKELGEQGSQVDNSHSWLDEQYAKLQKSQRTLSEQNAVRYALLR